MCIELSAMYDIRLTHGDIFLLLMSTAFMMGNFIQIVTYAFSPVSQAIVGKTNYVSFNSLNSRFLLMHTCDLKLRSWITNISVIGNLSLGTVCI